MAEQKHVQDTVSAILPSIVHEIELAAMAYCLEHTIALDSDQARHVYKVIAYHVSLAMLAPLAKTVNASEHPLCIDASQVIERYKAVWSVNND